MSNSINEMLSQIQVEFKNYRDKLANKSVIETQVVSDQSSDPFIIEDTYTYEAPEQSEISNEYYSNQLDHEGPIKEYVLECSCNNHNSDNETLDVIPIINTIPGPETPEVIVVPKKTDKEKSFFK